MRLGAEFVCMSPHRCTGPNADGSGKRATRNLAGDDRLTCFNCDFDMCRLVTDGKLGTESNVQVYLVLQLPQVKI